MTGGFAIDETVQPVVIIDDVSDLALPPVLAAWGFYSTVGAVVAQFTTWILQPRVRPLLVLDLALNVQAFWGVTDGDASTLAAAIVPGKIQGPVAATVDAVCRAGTTATDLSATANVPATTPTVIMQPNVLVLPGQYLFVQLSAVNIGGEVERLTWLEVPVDGDNVFTSLPRT